MLPCYVLRDRQSGLYLMLEYWCSGLEKWSRVDDVFHASRFTYEAAQVRVAAYSFDAGLFYKGSIYEVNVELDDVEIVYAAVLDRQQLILPIVGAHIYFARAGEEVCHGL